LCMLTTVLLGAWLTYREARRQGKLNENTLMVGAVGLLSGVIGAKASMVIFLGPGEFWRLLPTIPSHGAAWTGALIGGYLGVVLAERALKVKGVHWRLGSSIHAFEHGNRPVGQLPGG
jgi:prolipoprotein diacylglyceryltransferase